MSKPFPSGSLFRSYILLFLSRTSPFLPISKFLNNVCDIWHSGCNVGQKSNYGAQDA